MKVWKLSILARTPSPCPLLRPLPKQISSNIFKNKISASFLPAQQISLNIWNQTTKYFQNISMFVDMYILLWIGSPLSWALQEQSKSWDFYNSWTGTSRRSILRRPGPSIQIFQIFQIKLLTMVLTMIKMLLPCGDVSTSLHVRIFLDFRDLFWLTLQPIYISFA